GRMQDPVFKTALGIIADDDVQIGDGGLADAALDTAAGNQLVQAVGGSLREGVVAGKGGLDIGIDEQNTLSCVSEDASKVGGGGRFADPAFGRADGHYHWTPLSIRGG